MKKNNNLKRGSAIALCLIFATVLLIMGLAYKKLTSTARKQTVQIDERIKLDYLAHGMTELALLKFQLYPADYYACKEAAEYGDNSYLLAFAENASEFQIIEDTSSWSTFDNTAINLQLASMSILTDNKWNNEILYIEASAWYTNPLKKDETISKTVTRVVDLNRRVIK